MDLLVAIPDRDSSRWSSTKRQKPGNTVPKVSIPDRDSRSLLLKKAILKFASYFKDTC
jgi:hypothetical protein